MGTYSGSYISDVGSLKCTSMINAERQDSNEPVCPLGVAAKHTSDDSESHTIGGGGQVLEREGATRCL